MKCIDCADCKNGFCREKSKPISPQTEGMACFKPKTIYFCDFYLPEYRLVIEVDDSLHNKEEQVLKDRERDANLRSIGMKVVRVANTELRDMKRLGLRLGEYISF